MEPQGWLVLTVIIIFLVVLACELAPPDLVMLTAITFIWLVGIVPTDAYLKGFASSGLATVGALFVVVKGVDASGAIDRFFRGILGKQCSVRCARARLCTAMFLLSGLFNNTPLVAMIIPIVRDWARSRDFAPSLFLMPADFATVMGGLLTMIGTSTNLQVNDYLSHNKQETFGFLEPGYVGLPVGVIATCLMLIVSDFVLPRDKGGLFREMRQRGEDLVTALELPSNSHFHGQRVLDVLLDCKVPTTSLLKIRRPVHSHSPSTTVPVSEVIGAAHAGRDLDDDSPHSKSSGSRVKGVRSPASYLPPAAAAAATGVAAVACGGHHGRCDCHSGCGGGATGSGAHLPEGTVNRRSSTSPPRRSLSLASFEAELHPILLEDAGYAEIFPVSQEEIAQAGDILLLSMSREEVVGTLGRRTLGDGSNVRVSSIHASQIAGSSSEFVEVVLGASCPLVGQPISEGAHIFETHYRASMVALRPRGQTAAGIAEPQGCQEEADAFKGRSPVIRYSKPPATLAIGDTVMLLMPVGQELPRNDFLMVTRVGAVQPPTRMYDYIPVVLFVLGLCLAAAELVDMLAVAIVLLLCFVAGGWVSTADYAKDIDWRMLVLIGASTGMSEAMSRSGLSAELASVLQSGKLPRWAVLPVLFTVMVVVTEVVTNNAAVALGLPIALDLSRAMGLESHKPLTMAVMLGASVGFAMPMGYATHLMVYGPGGYSVKDFLKLGLFMDAVWIIGVSLLLPVVYPLV